MYAMSGPLSVCFENPKQNNAFSPTHPRLKPIGCAKKPINEPIDATPANQQPSQKKEDINLQFMNKGNRIFRSCPSLTSEYSEWLVKMEAAQSQIWEDMGIYDLVMLSKNGLAYCPLCISRTSHTTPSIYLVEW